MDLVTILFLNPTGYDQSFAQMTMAQKNEISHRGIAVKKLIHFLSIIHRIPHF